MTVAGEVRGENATVQSKGTVQSRGEATVDISTTARGKSVQGGTATPALGALQTITVVKRNGMLVPFRQDRVTNAIEAAFRAIRGISENLPLPLTQRFPLRLSSLWCCRCSL